MLVSTDLDDFIRNGADVNSQTQTRRPELTRRNRRDDTSKKQTGHEVRGNMPLTRDIEGGGGSAHQHPTQGAPAPDRPICACGLIWTRRTRRGDWHHTTRQLGPVSDSASSMDPTHAGSDDAGRVNDARKLHERTVMHGYTHKLASARART
jgi:hypothetical protein